VGKNNDFKVKNKEIEKLIFPTIQLLEILLVPLGDQYRTEFTSLIYLKT
jgi:hypothetical protein